MTGNDDEIDCSHWLPQNHPIVTAQRLAQRDLQAVETPRGGREVRAYAQDILGYYLLRGLINEEQEHAGKRLYALWYKGWAPRYTTIRYEQSVGRGHDDFEHVQQLALMYWDALQAIPGWRMRKMVYDVCCEGQRAGRGNLGLLRDGLDVLVKHFDA